MVPQDGVEGVDRVSGVELWWFVGLVCRGRENKVCVEEDVGAAGPRSRPVVLSRGVEEARRGEDGGGGRVPRGEEGESAGEEERWRVVVE